MKKLAAYTITFLLVTFFFWAPALAQNTIENPISESFKDIPSIVSSVSRWMRPLGIVALTLVITYGGYVRLTATGNPEKEKASALIIRSGIIGFIIIVLAPLLVDIVGSLLGIDLLQTND
ncbi:hypothetical protein KC909_02920 [Candidatus Dojkabacteria bacterium]|uniref:TrbC/VirB2 family protein n=1 Tax=Candidatus Dojkabacteria bacterium TaxID=2099670 RepID=A0A955RJ02_9BACT|nr:hypothetical protein [Candidatus Dojkabacteria bacterium]